MFNRDCNFQARLKFSIEIGFFQSLGPSGLENLENLEILEILENSRLWKTKESVN